MNKVTINSPTILLKWLHDIRIKERLYYLETTMMENDLKKVLSTEKGLRVIRISCCTGQPFMESFLVALAHYINTPQLHKRLENLIDGAKVDKYTIYQAFLYDCNLFFKENNVSVTLFYVAGQIDTFSNDDILLLEHALQECSFSIIQIVTHSISDNQIINLKTMSNNDRLDNVHFSYKHLDRHNDQIVKIEKGFVSAGIKYSIDKHLEVGDNIRSYETEIGMSKRVIIIITNEYLYSLQCMHEITEIVENRDFHKRVIGIAELTDIPRNGDGLKMVKDFWASEKQRKAEQIKDELGGSEYIIREIQDIDEIICHLNKVWIFLTDVLTGTMEDLSNNDGEKMVTIIKKSLDADIEKMDVDGMAAVSGSTANTFAPTPMPIPVKNIKQGTKSIYIEKNDGTINIS